MGEARKGGGGGFHLAGSIELRREEMWYLIDVAVMLSFHEGLLVMYRRKVKVFMTPPLRILSRQECFSCRGTCGRSTLGHFSRFGRSFRQICYLTHSHDYKSITWRGISKNPKGCA